MSQKILEAEWVYTGAAFALNHPLSQRLGAVWFVIGWLVLHAAVCLLGMFYLLGTPGILGSLIGLGGLLLLLLAMLLLIDLIGIVGLLGRHPIAWLPVWIILILTFPASLPLVVYWADGVKPNLIYAHRFERLVELDV